MSVKIEKIDEASVFVSGDQSGLQDLADYLTFFVPGYKFSPKYKARIWDGRIKLFSSSRGTLVAGLAPKGISHLRRLGHEVDVDSSVFRMFKRPEYCEETLDSFISGLDVRNEEGEEVDVWDHQIESIHRIAQTGRMTLLSPTSSGKSLIIYYVCRWFMMNAPTSRILIIVPTKMLVEQIYADFATYSAQDSSFNVVDEVHRIYSGKEKRGDWRVVVSTWQSIPDMEPEWYQSFGTLIIDEVHLASGKSLQKICASMTAASRRIGFTGTISEESKSDPMLIEGALGPIKKFITTAELMDKGLVASLNIRCLVLRHSSSDTQAVKDESYETERCYITSSVKRSRWITQLVRALPGNTLVLFTNKAHGRQLYDIAQQGLSGSGKKVYLRTGDDSLESRNELKPIMETELGIELYATYGILSTGVSIRNIDNVVFAGPSKGRVRVLQSIGRGLRTSGRKKSVNLWDISDDLNFHRGKKKKNHGIKHFLIRVQLYDSEQFNYRMETHDL